MGCRCGFQVGETIMAPIRRAPVAIFIFVSNILAPMEPDQHAE